MDKYIFEIQSQPPPAPVRYGFDYGEIPVLSVYSCPISTTSEILNPFMPLWDNFTRRSGFFGDIILTKAQFGKYQKIVHQNSTYKYDSIIL